METGATTACRCVLSQKPGGMAREGMAILAWPGGDPGVPGKVGSWEGARLEGFGRLDDDD